MFAFSLSIFFKLTNFIFSQYSAHCDSNEPHFFSSYLWRSQKEMRLKIWKIHWSTTEYKTIVSKQPASLRQKEAASHSTYYLAWQPVVYTASVTFTVFTMFGLMHRQDKINSTSEAFLFFCSSTEVMLKDSIKVKAYKFVLKRYTLQSYKLFYNATPQLLPWH